MDLMITNNGTHPPDKWADLATDQILGLIHVVEGSTSEAAAAARQNKRDLRPLLFDVFNKHFTSIQKGEVSEIAKDRKRAESRIISLRAPVESLEQEVYAAFDKTPFEEHFSKREVRDVLRTIMTQCAGDIINIERRHALSKRKDKGT